MNIYKLSTVTRFLFRKRVTNRSHVKTVTPSPNEYTLYYGHGQTLTANSFHNYMYNELTSFCVHRIALQIVVSYTDFYFIICSLSFYDTK